MSKGPERLRLDAALDPASEDVIRDNGEAAWTDAIFRLTTVATALRDAWCARGTKVQWVDYLFADHLLGVFSGSGDVINWLDARFTNQPPTPTCNA